MCQYAEDDLLATQTYLCSHLLFQSSNIKNVPLFGAGLEISVVQLESVFETRVIAKTFKRKFERKKEECNERLRNVYPSQNDIKITKSRIIRWAVQAAYIQKPGGKIRNERTVFASLSLNCNIILKRIRK